jgi:NTE family protein
MKPYIRDWRVGEIRDTSKVSLAKAVAASSAFPPILAPATFKFSDSDFTAGSGVAKFQRPPYTTEPTLADGGVYDNLGLETAYKRYRTLLVSNAGAPFAEQPEVHHDWARLGQRVIDLIDNQVGSLRKRLLVQSFQQRARYGAFWDINQAIEDFKLNDSLPCPIESTQLHAHLGTDLSAKDPGLQSRLINWGYAITDTAVRAYLDGSPLPTPIFPLPGGV